MRYAKEWRNTILYRAFCNFVSYSSRQIFSLHGSLSNGRCSTAVQPFVRPVVHDLRTVRNRAFLFRTKTENPKLYTRTSQGSIQRFSPRTAQFWTDHVPLSHVIAMRFGPDVFYGRYDTRWTSVGRWRALNRNRICYFRSFVGHRDRPAGTCCTTRVRAARPKNVIFANFQRPP